MVITADFSDGDVNLTLLLDKLDDAEYEPEQFPGLIYRMKKPRVSFLIFSSGKMNCTGATSLKEAKDGIDKMLRTLKRIGVKVRKPRIEVQNIVASAKLGARLNLDKIAFNLENSEYEPEQFPGLVYRITKPKVAFLLFGSGKIVCAGARNEKQITEALKYLVKRLKKLKAFKKARA